MGVGTAAKKLCCSVEGLRSLKQSFAFVVGGAFITIAVLSFFFGGAILNPIVFIRAVWNVIFGVLIVMLQFGKTKWLLTRFGFLGHWLGRALFYLFCGTNILAVDGFFLWKFITWVVGGMCIFVGFVEMMFGCRCEGQDEKMPQQSAASAARGAIAAARAAAPAGGFGQVNTVEPTDAGGKNKNKNKGGFANVFGGHGNQVDPAGGDSGGGEPSFTVNMTDGGDVGSRPANSAPNPFFGNSHLS